MKTRNLLKKATAVVLAGVMAASSGTVTFAEGENGNDTSDNMSLSQYATVFSDNDVVQMHTIIPSNDDPNFPLRMEVYASEDSVKYIKLDEPLYGFEYILNEKELDVRVDVSLKTVDEDFNNLKLTVSDSDSDSEIFSDFVAETHKITLSDLSVKKTYSFSANLTSESSSCEFVGEFTIFIELDGTLAIDLFYQKSVSESDISPLIAPNTEQESNNTQNSADFLQNGVSTSGSFLSTGDIDFFYYETPSYLPYGVANLDISLSVPANTRITMNVYCSTTTYNITKTSGTGTGIYFRIPNAALGSKYYIKLTTNSASSAEYYLTVNQYVDKAWFSQYVSTVGSVDYWNPNKLDRLQITYGAAKKPAFINNTDKNHWMREACGIASAAMVLRNKEKTMNGYDFRTNYSGNLPADPFSVMLANCGLDGKTMNVNTTSLSVGTSPDLFTSANIAPKFGVTAKTKGNGKLTCNSESDLQSIIRKYGSVMVRLKGSIQDHWMVFTGYNTSGSTFAGHYTVYDPAASSLSAGANILLSNTTSGYKNVTFGDILNVVVFE